MVKTSQNRNSVKIVLDFTDVSRLLVNNSAIPFLTAAEKRRFHPPKLPALRADVDGLAQKSAKPFLLLRRLRLLPLPKSARRLSSSALGVPATLPHVGATSGFQASGGYYTARLCPESRTNRRHGRDRLGLALWLCVQSVFSIKSAYFLFAMSSSSFCICRS